MESPAGLILRFHTADGTYRLRLEGSEVGERHSDFAPPFDPETWQAIAQALEPGFEFSKADPETQAALQALGDLDRLHQTTGAALAVALLADEQVRLGFDTALAIAEGQRQPLPVEMHFGNGCDRLAALPWELLYHGDRFLAADTSIALTRYPEGAIPPTQAMTNLPLRVLLVLSEPADASPIFPQEARSELLHGLRALDEVGAVIVDLLRPPTFHTLVEAVTTGSYQVVVFYGHGVYDEGEGGGCLLFEDEFGGGDLVRASELGAALRNTNVRLVVLGACQSAQVSAAPGPASPGVPGAGPSLWSATAPALLRAGVPLAVGMQVSMRVDAALAFLRQFALSLAVGKPVTEAVAEARKPLVRKRYGKAWFVPALYGRPTAGGRPGSAYRLFDPGQVLPEGTGELRAEMRARRTEISALERAIGQVGMLTRPAEIAHLREAKSAFARARAELARRTPGSYAAVTSPLYGVPSNDVFVGRSSELRDVSQQLAEEHPVVIWGTGGIGKTALAIEVAHRQSWRYPGGVLWLDCRGAPAWDSLLDRMGAFCGLPDMEQVPPDEKETQVRWALAGLGERCLLVWDNAEDVWGERSIRRFVETLPSDCQILLTTREDPKRAMWPTVELRPLVDEAMTELFYRLAAAARVKVGRQADLDSIPQIVAHLEGHPLALILVVPLAKDRGLARTWRELQARPPRGIEAAFGLSYDRLSGVQQRLFTRLSVFAIPFEWEAAEALLPGEGGTDEALDVLVGRALVGFDGASHAYHALLRQYAYGKLGEAEDPRPVHRLAAEYLRAKITDPDRGGTPDEGLEEVDQWERAGDSEEMARRASALVGTLDRLGYWGEIRERLERARAAIAEHLGSPPELDALLLSDLGTLASKSAEWDRAIEYYQQSLETMERVGDIHGMAQTYGNLGNYYQNQGDTDRAASYVARAYLIFAHLGARPEAEQAARHLVAILGSVDEANNYLSQFASEEE